MRNRINVRQDLLVEALNIVLNQQIPEDARISIETSSDGTKMFVVEWDVERGPTIETEDDIIRT